MGLSQSALRVEELFYNYNLQVIIFTNQAKEKVFNSQFTAAIHQKQG